MKKLIVALCLLGATVSASAHGYYYGYRGPVYYNNYGYNNNWVAPAVAGALVGAALARPYYAPPSTVYVQQPVYVQPPVTYVQQAAPAPGLPAGYHWQYILDPACDCYKYAMVPN